LIVSDCRKQTTDSKELNVVKKCRELYINIYESVKNRKDCFLWNHCLRTLVSVGSNLAEGNKRSNKEQLRFIRIANGSMAEFEFQYSLLNIINSKNDCLIDEIKAMTYSLKSAVCRLRSD